MINRICAKFEDKKILLLGYGREGKSTYRFIRKHYPKLPIGIYDKNEIKDTLEYVTLYGGSSYQELLSGYDVIMKSPGVIFRSDDPGDYGKLTSQTQLFLEFCREQTIGITGTKGKSTTASLMHHVLRSTGRDALLAGNIGVPVFDVLDKIGQDTWIVYELSSHQLQYAGCSPHIAVHLNIYQEHLDHYGSFEKYALAKENIFKFQQKGDLFVYNKEFIRPGTQFAADTLTISGTRQDADIYVKDSLIHMSGRQSDKAVKDSIAYIKINEDETLLKGQHNIYNMAAVYAVTGYLGISSKEFCEAVKTFKPLPHRLEYVGEVKGVKYYNDSISTICETTVQAVKCIKNIGTLILGGMDRGIDYKPLVDFLLDTGIENLILMPDTGFRIRKLIEDSSKYHKDKSIFMAADIGEAVKIAKQMTHSGRTCLFSPAAASYGFFKNFEERGDIYKRLVLE